MTYWNHDRAQLLHRGLEALGHVLDTNFVLDSGETDIAIIWLSPEVPQPTINEVVEAGAAAVNSDQAVARAEEIDKETVPILRSALAAVAEGKAIPSEIRTRILALEQEAKSLTTRTR